MQTGCVFCNILRGSEPASRVHEDAELLAFMDIRPVRAGQVLIVPKVHIDHFSDLDDAQASRILLLGQRIARALRELVEPKRVGMIVHGFGVPHAHLIVLPLEHPWDITSSANAYIESGAVKFRWDQVPRAARDDLDVLARRLADRLDTAATGLTTE